MARKQADVIVIGSGAAGAILMSELSRKFSVIGLEAGQNLTTDPAIQAIGLDAFFLPATAPQKYFWAGFKQTVPMPGINNRVADWTTGIIAGGGSAINGLYAGRGTVDVYEKFQQISGSDNWSVANILATFNRLETYEGLTMTPNGRGTQGKVHILQAPTISQMTLNQLLPAVQAALPAIPVIEDYNDPAVENGIDPRAQWFIDSSATQRVSSATAFLGPDVISKEGKGLHGHRLQVLFGCTVLRLLFKKCKKGKRGRKLRASGVVFVRNGKVCKLRARIAVIVSAGINSAKILQLSGIGPAPVLANAGIERLYVNENVGAGLQNHPTLFITLLADPSVNGVPPNANYAYSILNVYLPAVGGSASDPRLLQIIFEFFPRGTLGSPANVLVMGIVLVTPVSTGSVNIQSNNAFQIAAADDGFYTNPADINALTLCFQVYIQNILQQLALVDPPFLNPIPTDPINAVMSAGWSTAAVQSYIRANTCLNLDIHHFSGACKMAPRRAGGVVDGNLRVYGTENVYVCDMNICCTIPDINTTLAAQMIGLRASEFLSKILKKGPK
jgi:choline dehydrogenase